MVFLEMWTKEVVRSDDAFRGRDGVSSANDLYSSRAVEICPLSYIRRLDEGLYRVQACIGLA